MARAIWLVCERGIEIIHVILAPTCGKMGLSNSPTDEYNKERMNQ